MITITLTGQEAIEYINSKKPEIKSPPKPVVKVENNLPFPNPFDIVETSSKKATWTKQELKLLKYCLDPSSSAPQSHRTLTYLENKFINRSSSSLRSKLNTIGISVKAKKNSLSVANKTLFKTFLASV
jgi:thermostable 8-oxoguanine DNA glycosylase